MEVGRGQPEVDGSLSEGHHKECERATVAVPDNGSVISEQGRRSRTPPTRCRCGEHAELLSTLRRYTTRGFVFEPVLPMDTSSLVLTGKRGEKTTVGKENIRIVERQPLLLLCTPVRLCVAEIWLMDI
jgi:hypothetical protein